MNLTSHEARTDPFMKLTEYNGQRLHLAYPSFLKVKHKDPQWMAMGPRSTCPVSILVDPDPIIADAHAKNNRDQKITNMPGMEVDLIREGELRTPNGLVAHERLIKMTNKVGEVFWNWSIDGEIRGLTIIIQIDSPNDKWAEGSIWEMFLNSIQILETSTEESNACGQQAFSSAVVVDKSVAKAGALSELPPDLSYLGDLALKVGSPITAKSFDESSEFFDAIEVCLREKTAGLTLSKARACVYEDRKCLAEWLQVHPADKYPETAGLYAVLGALQYVDEIFK